MVTALMLASPPTTFRNNQYAFFKIESIIPNLQMKAGAHGRIKICRTSE